MNVELFINLVGAEALVETEEDRLGDREGGSEGGIFSFMRLNIHYKPGDRDKAGLGTVV